MSNHDDDHDIAPDVANMAIYLSEYLTSPHLDLGRSGAVCPFAAAAIAKNKIFIAECVLEEPCIDTVGMAILDIVPQLFGPDTGGDVAGPERLRSFVIVFPNVDRLAGSRAIQDIQAAMKPQMVARGLMIGEFYPGCPARGLHNEDFRPFDAPVVSLAVRRMTEFDGPFMVGDSANLASFRRYFPNAAALPVRAARLPAAPAPAAAGMISPPSPAQAAC